MISIILNCVELKKTGNTWCLKLVIMNHTHPPVRMQLRLLCTTNALITKRKIKEKIVHFEVTAKCFTEKKGVTEL